MIGMFFVSAVYTKGLYMFIFTFLKHCLISQYFNYLYLQLTKLSMRDKRQRSDSGQKKEDPNKWHVDIYNLPQHVNTQDICFFVWKALQKCRALKKSTTPIVRSEYFEDIRCVRLFFRSKQQTLNCLDLNGILYGQKSFYMKSPLRMRDHPIIESRFLQIKRLSQKVEDSFNKLVIQNLPSIQQYEVVNLLRKYGQLKAFQPVYAQKNMSFCYAQFENSQETQECLAKLNNQKLKSKTIAVQRAVLAKQTGNKSTITKVRGKSSLFQKDAYSFYLTFDTIGYFKAMKISCVLLLKNIIANMGEKQFVKNDVKCELEKVGKLTRFVQKEKNVYAEYQKVEYAQIAYLVLMNRKYEGKSLDVSFYDPISFSDDILV